MPKTYEPIASVTFTTATATYSFSTIPNTYTDLILIGSIVVDGNAGGLGIRFNNDTGTNYSTTLLFGNGSTAGSNRYSNSTMIYAYDSTALNQTASAIVHFQNYANTTTYKTTLNRWNSSTTGDRVHANAGLWRSTAAISTINLLSNNSWATGTIFTLYGIKAA
jgi:hypothetical protein